MMEQPMQPMAQQQPMAMSEQSMSGQPARPQSMQKPMEQPKVHVVKPGDTFSGICQRYGADQKQVAQMNGIANPNYIVVGQEIVIP